MTAPPIRFGLQLASDLGDDPAQQVVAAEAAGFDVVVVGDHIGPGYAPMQLLGAVAQATSRIRLGTLVLNADVRNPTQIAWEAVTLDHLSGGRFELGLGAGHTPHEYDALGLMQRPAQKRKRRLMEVVEIVRRLLDGETVDHSGEYVTVSGAEVGRSVQERLPILVGGNGEALLTHAGANADIVGLQGLGRTLADGHRHSVRWTVEHLEAQLDQVRTGAAGRRSGIELNALVQVVDITDDRERSLDEIAARIDGADAGSLGQLPYLLVGTIDEIADQVLAMRERWGISYYVVRDIDAFTPVIPRVRELGG